MVFRLVSERLTKMGIRKINNFHIAFGLGGFIIFVYALPMLSHFLVNLSMLRWTSENVLTYEYRNSFIEIGHLDARLLEIALELDKNNIRAHHWLGFANAQSGSLQEAVIHWKATRLEGDYFTAWGDYLLEFGNVGNDSTALQWYERALALDPNWSDAWYRIGDIHYRQQGWQRSLRAYSMAIASNNFQNLGISDAYTKQALIYQSVEKYKDVNKALNAYNIALSINDFTSDKLQAEAHYKRGEIYYWQNRDARSIVEYKKALSIAPYHRWARLRLGVSLYQIYGDVKLSEEQIKIALASWPEDTSKKWPYQYLGKIYWDAGFFEKAIVAYQNALKFDPSDKNLQHELWQLTEENDNICCSKRNARP